MSELPVNAHSIVFADSSEVCSGIGVLGLVLSLVFAQEWQDNRPQQFIHVRLTDQVFLYNHQICCHSFKHLPRDLANVNARKPMFAQ